MTTLLIVWCWKYFESWNLRARYPPPPPPPPAPRPLGTDRCRNQALAPCTSFWYTLFCGKEMFYLAFSPRHAVLRSPGQVRGFVGVPLLAVVCSSKRHLCYLVTWPFQSLVEGRAFLNFLPCSHRPTRGPNLPTLKFSTRCVELRG